MSIEDRIERAVQDVANQAADDVAAIQGYIAELAVFITKECGVDSATAAMRIAYGLADIFIQGVGEQAAKAGYPIVLTPSLRRSALENGMPLIQKAALRESRAARAAAER